MLIITSKKRNTLNPHRLGKGRAEIETNLKKEWGSASLNDEQIDKCKYLERKTGLKEGFMDTGVIDRVR
jgi:hypothetical protein